MGKKHSKAKKPQTPEEVPENVPLGSGGESSRSEKQIPKQEGAKIHSEFKDTDIGGESALLQQYIAELEAKQASAQGQPSTAKLVRQSPVEEPESAQK